MRLCVVLSMALAAKRPGPFFEGVSPLYHVGWVSDQGRNVPSFFSSWAHDRMYVLSMALSALGSRLFFEGLPLMLCRLGG